MNEQSVFQQALACLMECNLEAKVAYTGALSRDWARGSLTRVEAGAAQHIPSPGRPDKPALVASHMLHKRRMVSKTEHAAFVHALAHIEFNAINLACDAVYRFRDMPDEYYSDWIRVAKEEAYHFTLLRDYLKTLDHDYGDFDAHNGLWEMAVKTEHDVLVRMALVPRVLEARGLDVTPGMIERLNHHGKTGLAEILKIIYRDEIGHVEVGSRWFGYLCNRRGLDEHQTFRALIETHARDRIRPPLNEEAREQAGFSREELDYLNTYLE